MSTISKPKDEKDSAVSTKKELEDKGIVGVVNSRLTTGAKVQVWSWAVFALVWAGSGAAALIASFVCLGMEGHMSAKIAGIFLALILGPFYWVFFAVLKVKGQYCVLSAKK